MRCWMVNDHGKMSRINGDVFNFTGEFNGENAGSPITKAFQTNSHSGRRARHVQCFVLAYQNLQPCNQVSFIKLAVVGWTHYQRTRWKERMVASTHDRLGLSGHLLNPWSEGSIPRIQSRYHLAHEIKSVLTIGKCHVHERDPRLACDDSY
jgi:hypothetical protein